MTAASESLESDSIIQQVCTKINEYILLLKPDSNVFIAFDGVAPVAKLDQQRSRRYKSQYLATLTNTLFHKVKQESWNTAAITPGTYFMQKLNRRLCEVFHSPANFQVQQIIVSTSDSFGEGEHKLFEYIRQFPEQHKEQNTVIYGLDADLIMLSINHLHISNQLYLFRETPEFIKSINAELEPNENYLLDIPELAHIITSNMSSDTIAKTPNRLHDYIFLCFFLGNDFMPHFPSVNIRTGGIDKMLTAYKETIGTTNETLTDGKTICWKNVRKLVKQLANNEEEFLKKETKLRDRRETYAYADDTPEEKLKKFDAIPTYKRTLEKYINPFKPYWQERYYKSLFAVEPDAMRKQQICVNYLEGLEWTMKYYTSGCPDWRWRYKYDYPPLFSDLIQHVPYFNATLIEPTNPSPVSDLVQLCYVLPKQSLHFLPENLVSAMTSKHGEWHSANCQFVWAYCRYFWESHVKLPHIDIAELVAFSFCCFFCL
jgi:5'-3' exonuclease